LIQPWIAHRHARSFVIAHVTRDDCQAMMECGRGDDQIGLRGIR
jgi:hypothetical protein